MGTKSIKMQTPEQLIDIIETQARQNEWLNEQLRFMMNKQFGRKKKRCLNLYKPVCSRIGRKL